MVRWLPPSCKTNTWISHIGNLLEWNCGENVKRAKVKHGFKVKHVSNHHLDVMFSRWIISNEAPSSWKKNLFEEDSHDSPKPNPTSLENSFHISLQRSYTRWFKPPLKRFRQHGFPNKKDDNIAHNTRNRGYLYDTHNNHVWHIYELH